MRQWVDLPYLLEYRCSWQVNLDQTDVSAKFLVLQEHAQVAQAIKRKHELALALQVIDNPQALPKTLAERLTFIEHQIFELTVEDEVADLQRCHWVHQNLVDIDLHYFK